MTKNTELLEPKRIRDSLLEITDAFKKASVCTVLGITVALPVRLLGFLLSVIGQGNALNSWARETVEQTILWSDLTHKFFSKQEKPRPTRRWHSDRRPF